MNTNLNPLLGLGPLNPAASAGLATTPPGADFSSILLNRLVAGGSAVSTLQAPQALAPLSAGAMVGQPPGGNTLPLAEVELPQGNSVPRMEVGAVQGNLPPPDAEALPPLPPLPPSQLPRASTPPLNEGSPVEDDLPEVELADDLPGMLPAPPMAPPVEMRPLRSAIQSVLRPATNDRPAAAAEPSAAMASAGVQAAALATASPAEEGGEVVKGSEMPVDLTELPVTSKPSESPKPLTAVPVQGVAPDPVSAIEGVDDASLMPTPRAAAAQSVQQPVPVSAPQTQTALDMSDQGWDNDLSNRIRWQVGAGQQTAQIKLSPPHLGALEIRVTVHNDQTQVQLVSQHAVVRDVMEANLPRLREMLAEQGMNQVNVNVSDQSLAQQRGRDQPQAFQSPAAVADSDDDITDAPSQSSSPSGSQSGIGQVDYFA